MENAKIRVNSGIRINVNDNGDCIVANVNDNALMEGFYNLVEKIEGLSKEMSTVKVDVENAEEAKKYMELVKEKTQIILNEINGLFGENASEKIFGAEVSPSGYAIAEFFDQLVPIFEKYADERQKSISNRYTRRRKGKN